MGAVEIKVRADQIQKDDVLVTFGWAVGDIRPINDAGAVALSSADGKHSTAFPASLTVRVLRKTQTQTPLVEQWRQLAADHAAEAAVIRVTTYSSDCANKAELAGRAATFDDCANQLDERMTRLHTLLDSWDASVRKISELAERVRNEGDPEGYERYMAEQDGIRKCAAELRGLVQP